MRELYRHTGKLLCAAWLGSLLLLLPRLGYSETHLKISHQPPSCAAAEKPIRLAADIVAAAPPQAVRAYFRRQGAAAFYFVELKPAAGETFAGTLPAPLKSDKTVEYLLLVAADKQTIVKSPLFSLAIREAAACPGFTDTAAPAEIVVAAEEALSPEIGFAGKNVRWEVATAAAKPYLQTAVEIPATAPAEKVPNEQDKSIAAPTGGFKLKKALLIGGGVVGAGAVGLLVAGKGSSSDNDVAWTLSAEDAAANVGAELRKTPLVQTSCGAVVTNQLYVANRRADLLKIGTIDYEIVLTKDNPAGSCEAGRTGAFAPNLLTDVKAGETALIREWANKVNPCEGCPYILSSCQWRSRYIVHTSAGSAVAEAMFSVEGKNLCANPTGKPVGNGRKLAGDVEP